MKRSAALVVGFAVGLAGCSGEEVVLDFPRTGVDTAQAVEMDRARRVLIASCPGVTAYRDSYRPVSVRRGDPSETDRREIGWAQVTEFAVTIKASVQGDLAQFRAAGHNCSFAVGDRPPVGVSTAKRACLSLCTGRTTEQSYGFIPAPPGLYAGAR